MIVLIKKEKPVHMHDCDDCIYLGTYSNYRTGSTDKHVDCYWCNKGKSGTNLASILGRYSSYGPDYSASHPPEAFASQQDYLHYAEAWYLFSLLQATRLGLYKPNTDIKQVTYAEVK